MALTAQDVVNQLNKVPLPQKLAVLAALVAGLTAANYFLVVQPMFDDIARKQQDLRKLEDDLIQKQQIANNLGQFKHDKEVLERKLAQALTELPNETNMGELISSISEIGNKSQLIINNIEPQAEQPQGFYASIPVVMSVTGNYHEIGVFLDSLSKLARIVNVTNIKMTSPRLVNEKLVVSASYVATTFRFLPQAPGGGK
jgi:type IV pilus assembly protein PilO